MSITEAHSDMDYGDFEFVDLHQGDDHKFRPFGYVAGDKGGFFFTWLPTLDDTLESVEEDPQDGSGGLDEGAVREFLESYLPTTNRGRNAWENAEEEWSP